MIVVDALISPTGCVNHSKLIRAIPALDLAALRAVSAWRFTPTVIDGVAVAVSMTVTINFALQ